MTMSPPTWLAWKVSVNRVIGSIEIGMFAVISMLQVYERLIVRVPRLSPAGEANLYNPTFSLKRNSQGFKHYQ
jgi:hypothetical protein